MDTPLLTVSQLSKKFVEAKSLLHSKTFNAVENVAFELHRGKTLSIIGKNSSGKSTVAKMIVGLVSPTSGNMRFKNTPLQYGDYHFRAKHIRMLFQNTQILFNTRLNVGQILDEPLKIMTDLDQASRDKKIAETLRLVGLYPDHANIRITTMSASQKQRVAFARALILNPEIIIIDDAFASLDATVKIQMMNLLLKVQKKLGVAYIYVGQHLGIIKHISDDILVMDNGKPIEYGSTREVFTDPKSEITRRLIEGDFGKLLTDDSWYENTD